MTLYCIRFGHINGKTITKMYRKVENRQALIDAIAAKSDTLSVLATWTEETAD